MSQRIHSPWPAPTPTEITVPSEPSTSALPTVEGRQHGDVVPAARSLKRRRLSYDAHGPSYLQRRQDNETPDWDAIAAAQDECATAGNGVVSCYPTSDTTFSQNSWVTFVWNSKQPSYAQTDSVNIYLFHAESLEQMYVFRDVQNPLYGTPGVLRTQINDTWWPSPWSGGEDTYSYFFQIKRSDQELDGSDVTQSRFNAVQTTYANSVLSSMSSASEATATSSSIPSSITASSSSPTGGSVVTTTDSNGDPITYTTNSDGAPTDSNGSTLSTDSNGVPTSTGAVQNDGSGGRGFPNWGIGLIVALGFVAILLGCVLVFLIGRRLRRRRELESNRNSMGSSTPMMANHPDSGASPLMSPSSGNHAALTGAAAAGGLGAAAGAYSADRHSSLGHDGASTISAGDNGPFSGADAAIMADAFRKALRKPDFAGRPVEEGDSPEQEDINDRNTPTPVPSGMLSRELAEEGRDIRSVSSSRGVRIEGSEDGASTVHHDY